MEQNFDSHLKIKYVSLGSFPMLEHREVMHLQCFPPTFYARQEVKGEAMPVIEANVIERTVRLDGS